MKIIKTSSGKKRIKMSKAEWTSIGKKAGWLAPGKMLRDIFNKLKGGGSIDMASLAQLKNLTDDSDIIKLIDNMTRRDELLRDNSFDYKKRDSLAQVQRMDLTKIIRKVIGILNEQDPVGHPSIEERMQGKERISRPALINEIAEPAMASNKSMSKKASGKKRIKLSKSKWESIGKTDRWSTDSIPGTLSSP